MPTGFTKIIDDDPHVTFERFVWRCARGMGALITLCDTSLDAPVPTGLEPDTGHHDREIARAEARLAELRSMTAGQAEDMASATHAEAMAQWEEGRRHDLAVQARYRAMRERVESWEPPSPDHDGLKRFMLEQLDTCIREDDSERWKPVRLRGADWRRRQLASAASALKYHVEEREKEIGRTVDRNEWLAKLRASVPQPTPASEPEP